MKQGIHPEYVECTVRCTCGNTWTTRSTKSEMTVDLCDKCHPFYTGTQKLVDTGGRVQRFSDKFGGAAAAQLKKAEEAKAARAAKAAEEAAAKKAAKEAKAAEKAKRAAEFEKKAAAEAAKKAEQEAAEAEAAAETVEAEAAAEENAAE
jgi:large subunit ribosomal protein L31